MACTWPTDDGKGVGPDLIVDDGGDMTMLIHEGYKAELEFAKSGKKPDPASTKNAEMKIVFRLLAREVRIFLVVYSRLRYKYLIN
jgi:adenosylhomocysteinase